MSDSDKNPDNFKISYLTKCVLTDCKVSRSFPNVPSYYLLLECFDGLRLVFRSKLHSIYYGHLTPSIVAVQVNL